MSRMISMKIRMSRRIRGGDCSAALHSRVPQRGRWPAVDVRHYPEIQRMASSSHRHRYRCSPSPSLPPCRAHLAGVRATTAASPVPSRDSGHVPSSARRAPVPQRARLNSCLAAHLLFFFCFCPQIHPRPTINERWHCDVRRRVPGSDEGNVFGVFHFCFELYLPINSSSSVYIRRRIPALR